MCIRDRLRAERTNIPGMLVFDLPVHGDSRGWFKENWQREKMRALGLPDMGPVQKDVYKRQTVLTLTWEVFRTKRLLTCTVSAIFC